MNNVPDVFQRLLRSLCPAPQVRCPRCGGEGWVEGTGYDPRLDAEVTRQYECTRCNTSGYITEGEQ